MTQYLAWKGVDDDSRIFYATFDGVRWSDQQLTSAGGTSAGPALSNFLPHADFQTSDVMMAWKGVAGDSRIFYATFDAVQQQWSDQQLTTAGGTSDSPAVQWLNFP